MILLSSSLMCCGIKTPDDDFAYSPPEEYADLADPIGDGARLSFFLSSKYFMAAYVPGDSMRLSGF